MFTIYRLLTVCSLYVHYIQTTHCLFTTCSLYTDYSLFVHYMFTIYRLLTVCSLYVHYIQTTHCLFTIYSLSYLSNPIRIFEIDAMEAVLWLVKCVYFFDSPSIFTIMFTMFSLYVYYMFTISSLCVHYMFTICSLYGSFLTHLVCHSDEVITFKLCCCNWCNFRYTLTLAKFVVIVIQIAKLRT